MMNWELCENKLLWGTIQTIWEAEKKLQKSLLQVAGFHAKTKVSTFQT